MKRDEAECRTGRFVPPLSFPPSTLRGNLFASCAHWHFFPRCFSLSFPFAWQAFDSWTAAQLEQVLLTSLHFSYFSTHRAEHFFRLPNNLTARPSNDYYFRLLRRPLSTVFFRPPPRSQGFSIWTISPRETFFSSSKYTFLC